MKFVTQHDEMPKTPHWAIITYKSIYIEGDERSRICPGHGYPAHYHQYVSYQAFLDEGEWHKAIAELSDMNRGKPVTFTAMKVMPAIVTTSVSVNVITPA
jgi:hypothetical protein